MRLRICIIPVLAILFPSVLSAQDGSVRSDFEYYVDANPFLRYDNASFLSLMPQSKLSIATAQARKGNGELMGLEQSPDFLEGGACTESYVKISDRIAFHGKLSYSYFHGNRMGAQILLEPEASPVNFLERTDTTLGVKVREMFNLCGGMSYSFNDSWSAGVRIDYTSGDMAKRKDPRFLNTLMDLDLSAGTSFMPSDRLAFGLSLDFEERMEQVRGHVYGTSGQIYSVYTDKGGFFGVSDQLDGDYAYIPTTENRPLVDKCYGVSLQASVFGNFSLHNELFVKLRDGYFGQDVSSKPVFFEFSGFSAGYSGTASVKSGINVHRLSLDASFGTLNNLENNFKYVTEPGKSTVVEYIGRNSILDRMDMDGKLEYTLLHGNEAGRPVWEYGLSAKAFSRNQTTTLYPYERKHGYTRMDFCARVQNNRAMGKAVFSTTVSAGFHAGFGVDKEDSSLASTSSSSLKSFDNYLGRQFEYETASRAGAALGFRYKRQIREKLSAYVSLTDSFQSLLKDPEYLGGRFRNEILLSIGAEF